MRLINSYKIFVIIATIDSFKKLIQFIPTFLYNLNVWGSPKDGFQLDGEGSINKTVTNFRLESLRKFF